LPVAGAADLVLVTVLVMRQDFDSIRPPAGAIYRQIIGELITKQTEKRLANLRRKKNISKNTHAGRGQESGNPSEFHVKPPLTVWSVENHPRFRWFVAGGTAGWPAIAAVRP
jgi:hypothetical protein